MEAKDIQDAIAKRLQEQITVYPCHNLRASNLGHPCSRYLYLLIKHWEEQEPHDIGLQSIFNLGNSIEDYTIKELKAAGFEVVTPVQRSWKVEIKGGIITGREDIRIKDPADGQFYPGEIKGLAPQEWERLNSVDDFLTSKRYYIREYPAQLFTYMLHFGKERGFFIITNKLTGAIKVIQVDMNFEYGESLLSKGEYIYECLADPTEQMIPDGCDDITVCDRCTLKHICTTHHAPAEAEFDDGEIEELINKREELRAAKNAFDDVSDELKRAMAGKEKVITDNYLVTTRTIHKDEYTVKARDEVRVVVRKL